MFVCVTLGFFAGKIGFGARHKKSRPANWQVCFLSLAKRLLTD
jgi:hypothetical protein